MKRNKESSVRAAGTDTQSNPTPEGFVSPRSHFLVHKAKRVEGKESKHLQGGKCIKKNRQLEELTPEEFASKMEKDSAFRNEMVRRQQAAVDRIESRHKENRERWKQEITSIEAQSLSPYLSDETVFYGGGCSSYFIRTAPIEKLREAVRSQKLSKVRFNIEIKRRKNKEFYKNIPDITYSPVVGK